MSTEWVDYVEEPMKYQALRPHFFPVVGGWRVLQVGWVARWWWGGWGWWGGFGWWVVVLWGVGGWSFLSTKRIDLCGGTHEISGIKAPLFLHGGWLEGSWGGWVMVWVGGGWVGVWW